MEIKIVPHLKTAPYAAMSYVPSKRLVRIHGFRNSGILDDIVRWTIGFLSHETVHDVVNVIEGKEACKWVDTVEEVNPYAFMPCGKEWQL